MKLSLVIPILNSHEIVRRQLLHWDHIGLTTDADDPPAEVILVDDGSDPPIEEFTKGLPGLGRNLRILATHDYRPWTWALARNFGAKHAQGDYLLMVDLDYILPRIAIDTALAFTGDKLRFKREFGVLDENGIFTQDFATLNAYGLPWERINEKGARMPPHPNNFCMRRKLYLEMGGFREDRIGTIYPQGEDRHFKRKWIQFVESGKARESEADDRPTIFMFPNGQFCGDVDHNPFGLFHTLSRKNDFNPAHKKLMSK